MRNMRHKHTFNFNNYSEIKRSKKMLHSNTTVVLLTHGHKHKRRDQMMLLHGLLVTAEDDNIYSVRDCNRVLGYIDCNRVLGYIVRHFVPGDPYPSAKRMFRAFGEDFKSLSDACAEYLKVRGCRPRNALGDCEGSR